MTGKQLAPRADARVVPRRTRIAARVQAPPALPPAAHARRAWLRELLAPPEPHTYLADGETCVVATRFHWTAPLRKMFRTAVKIGIAGALLFVLSVLTPGVFLLQAVLFLAALSHTAWLGYVILRWRTDHVLVTDRRIIRVSGIVALSAEAVNLDQVTDATLAQSLLGRILDYGTIRIESAGQRQAIEQLDDVPAPGAVYRAALSGGDTA